MARYRRRVRYSVGMDLHRRPTHTVMADLALNGERLILHGMTGLPTSELLKERDRLYAELGIYLSPPES